MHAKIAIPANITLEVFFIRFSRLLNSDAQAPLLVADPLPDRFASLEFQTSLVSAFFSFHMLHPLQTLQTFQCFSMPALRIATSGILLTAARELQTWQSFASPSCSTSTPLPWSGASHTVHCAASTICPSPCLRFAPKRSAAAPRTLPSFPP